MYLPSESWASLPKMYYREEVIHVDKNILHISNAIQDQDPRDEKARGQKPQDREVQIEFY